MSAEAFEGAPRWQAVLFTAIPVFGLAAAIALMAFGGSLQPLGSPQAATPVISTPAPDEPSKPTAEQPAPAPEPEPSAESTPEQPKEPVEPVDLGAPTNALGIALVEEFGADTTFWRGGEQVRDPERGDTFRAAYLPTATVGEPAVRWIGDDTFVLIVEKNSEADGIEVLIRSY